MFPLHMLWLPYTYLHTNHLGQVLCPRPQLPHSCLRSHPSPSDSYPAPASAESRVWRCSPARTGYIILGVSTKKNARVFEINRHCIIPPLWGIKSWKKCETLGQKGSGARQLGGGTRGNVRSFIVLYYDWKKNLYRLQKTNNQWGNKI